MNPLLRSGDYLRVFAGVGGSYVGVWMAATAVQWYLVSSPATASLAPAALTAVSLPMALLAPVSGSLADAHDRRRLIGVQASAFAVTLLLTGLSWTGSLSSTIVLLLTVLLGCTAALTLTPVQSLVPDVVDRDRIPEAASLIAIASNGARVVGPALAGVALAAWGQTAAFALVAAVTLLLLAYFVSWRFRDRATEDRERFVRSISAGIRFVRYSPQALKVLVRALWFTTFMVAVFALLPLVGAERLHVQPSGFGLLLAAQGAGAFVAAVALPPVRRRVSPDRLVMSSFLIGAVASAAMAFVSAPVQAWVLLAVAGWAWTASLATLVAELQVYLPGWVRARGISLFYSCTFGGQALGSLAFASVAHRLASRQPSSAAPSLWPSELGCRCGCRCDSSTTSTEAHRSTGWIRFWWLIQPTSARRC